MEIIELITTTTIIINLLYSREEKYAFLFLIFLQYTENICIYARTIFMKIWPTIL